MSLQVEPGGSRLRAALAVANDAALALLFLAAWIDPAIVPIAGDLLVMTLVQFVLVFGYAFIVFGVRVKGWRWFTLFLREGPVARGIETALLSAFLLLFIVGISLSAGTWWPTLLFVRVILGGALFAPKTRADKAYLHIRTVFMILALILGLTLAALLPLPAFGAPEGSVRAPGDTTTFADAPHRGFFFGFLFYGGTALFEWFLVRKVTPERAIDFSRRSGASPGPLDEPEDAPPAKG